MKKSLFKLVNVEKGKIKDVVPVEVVYDNRTKASMMAIIDDTIGGKHQRSNVSRNKKIEDSFPIAMSSDRHGWKLIARLPWDPKDQTHFEFIVDDRDFLDLDFIPLSEEDSKTLRGVIIMSNIKFLAEDQDFEWHPHTAANRIVKKIGKNKKI